MTATTNQSERARIARELLEGIFNQRNPEIVERYIDPSYIQHNPLIPNGTEPVKGFVGSLSGVTQPIIDIKRVVAEGDFVVVHSHFAWTPQFQLDGGNGTAVADIFRFNDRNQIVEHRDVAQAVPDTTASGNDLFSQLIS